MTPPLDERDGGATHGDLPPEYVDLRDAQTNTSDATPSPERLYFITFDEIQVRASSSGIVKGLIAAGELSVIYGESGGGKTFFALDLALHVAANMTWRGLKVRQCGVIYIAAEAGPGIQNRVVAFRQRHKLSGSVPFAVVPCPVDLCSGLADTEDLLKLIRKAAQKFEMPVGLIFIDTVSRALAGGNENSSEDMGALVMHLDDLKIKTGAHVSGVHHNGKDAARGARGHSLLRAAIDTEIEVSRDKNTGVSVAQVVKQRELPTEGSFPFVLDRVELGRDNDGDTITSCVVRIVDEPSDTGAAALAAKEERTLAATDQIVLKALRNAVADRGEHPPRSRERPNKPAVQMGVWEDYAVRVLAEGSDRKPDSRRRMFGRSAKKLQAREIVGYHDGWVWLCR